jgi:hypothetical protein
MRLYTALPLASAARLLETTIIRNWNAFKLTVRIYEMPD